VWQRTTHLATEADNEYAMMQADTLIADKAFDADERLMIPLSAAGKAVVIPLRAHCNEPRTFNRHIYKERIENFVAKLK
jgi:hypothetical protein